MILDNKIKLLPQESRVKEIENDYKSMKEMLYGVIPTLDEILNSLKELEEIINRL